MKKTSVTLAKSAGFCFGVERAVKMVLEAVEQGERVCTLGPIIHNTQMVEELAQKGVTVINSPEEACGGRVIIRSHGVGREVYQKLCECNILYTDATCPFVMKIHLLVENAEKDSLILIAGDQNHPEVQGIIGHCNGRAMVVSDGEAIKSLDARIIAQHNQVIFLAQTTYNRKEWENCKIELKKVCTKMKIFDTICNATVFRQQEAEALAKDSDLMIVIGGRHSSNTQKLALICAEHCTVVAVETVDELTGVNFEGVHAVAITAGASTPVRIIKEVYETMSEILENQDQDQDELSFEEMLALSFKSTYNGEKVTGVVTGIAPNEISVDIGTKHAGYVPLAELTDDPNAKPEDIVKKGDELQLLVVRVNDVEGTVMLSKKRLDAQAGFEKVMGAAETGEILEGVVTEVIKGGVLALTNGVKVFIPASQATNNRSDALEALLRKKVSFKILEVNRQRRRAVGSIRAVMRDVRREQEDLFWKDVEIGRRYEGVVKSLTDYGAFIDLGGVDGMAHISELSWAKIRHPSQVVKVGDTINVFVKDLDHEKKKISLGYKKDEDNPWTILKNSFAVGQTAHVKVVSLTAFGAFAELIAGIDGLIHISQISLERVGKPSDVLAVGQEVDVKITELDFENRRISLSIRALLEENAEQQDAEEQDVAVTEAPTEA